MINTEVLHCAMLKVDNIWLFCGKTSPVFRKGATQHSIAIIMHPTTTGKRGAYGFSVLLMDPNCFTDFPTTADTSIDTKITLTKLVSSNEQERSSMNAQFPVDIIMAFL